MYLEFLSPSISFGAAASLQNETVLNGRKLLEKYLSRMHWNERMEWTNGMDIDLSTLNGQANLKEQRTGSLSTKWTCEFLDLPTKRDNKGFFVKN